MYQEWMDGYPLLIDGLYDYNIEQMQIAKNYYLKNNKTEIANYYEKMITEERKKLKGYLNRPSKLKQIINIIFS
jgi:hypothetical protein